MKHQQILWGILSGMLVGGAWIASPSPAWGQDALHKLGRGGTNALTCWVELPKQFSAGKQEPNAFGGMALGLVRGIGLTAVRLGVGVYELVTFPLPYPQGYASPYDQMELADYPWEP